jgi:hypothetical protein
MPGSPNSKRNSCDLTVTVAYYPTGTSKWNPIEHLLLSEIFENWAAEPLDSYQKILNFLRTTTKTGLEVSAYLDGTHYPTGLDADPVHFRSLRNQKHYRLGTTRSPQICEVISAWALGRP